MERGAREREQKDRESLRDRDPPTLALHMKSWKCYFKQLRVFCKFMKENTTVTFTGTPSIIFQSVKQHHILKLTINPECLYVTDRDNFHTKTINNSMALFDSFTSMISNPEMTKMYIQDDSSLYTKFLVTTADVCAQTSVPCVNGQEIVRATEKFSTKIDLDHGTVTDLIRWLAPVTRNKRSSKTDSVLNVLIYSSPPSIKLITETNEMEFSSGTRVTFHDVKNQRLALSVRNFYQALSACTVVKSSTTLKVMHGKDVKMYLITRSGYLILENFITQEMVKEDKADKCRSDDIKERILKEECGKGDLQSKITNYLPSKSSIHSIFDRKDDSDSEDEDSMTFEYSHISKKQKC
ncbi:DNA polymerase processivity subunit pp41 [Suid betaherpesvirus 2]|uniref:DNA polymerase processivity factor n=1 Tax=Suid betaherpesvirus 2 TaxID=1608255 RepID=U3GPJ6_9BETA|nr:DNA polymerase processivity subunit pp41 [Suid betaherpesvirus 2]AGT99221.1 DNA polymerase processivity subunit pp41 [Suid betaherpesvirus 2]